MSPFKQFALILHNIFVQVIINNWDNIEDFLPVVILKLFNPIS